MVPNDFKWEHFAPTIILWCLRWYGPTPLSYANISGMLAESRISVHRSTIYRWFIEYAPVLRKKRKRYQFIRTVSSWQFDETYVKVNGKWFYLNHVIGKHSDKTDVCFFPKCSRHVSYVFLSQVLKSCSVGRQPKISHTDKHASYGYAIGRLINCSLARAVSKLQSVPGQLFRALNIE